MANITGKKAIFFVTSPRTPFKMIDEIRLLISNYNGRCWNTETQTLFAKDLSKTEFFEGDIISNLDFAARDRINRAPKALGFVDLKPVLKLTDAGSLLLSSTRPDEIFTRQLLKFQLPSPYHVDKNNFFGVRPYLELLRLVYDLEYLSKDEIAIFVMQLTNVKTYDIVKNKILDFRKEIKGIDKKVTSYKRCMRGIFEKELGNIFYEEIKDGDILTRESSNHTLEYFIRTKKQNHRDYADAAIRYLRATKLISINPKSYNIYIPPEKKEEVKFILDTIPREPVKFLSVEDFKKYLFNNETPKLLSDNADSIIKMIKGYNVTLDIKKLQNKSTEYLKDIRDQLSSEKLYGNISQQINELQTYNEYDDIIETYKDIENKNAVDPSLIMEWNTWRAFVMLDDGEIEGNFRFDESGMPLYNALGNMPDILCIYEDFDIIVEVTLSSGQKQYEMEGEPVSRHLGNHKKNTKKETYCIFITPSLNHATLAHFFMAHKVNVSYYGGAAKIIPLQLSDFKQMLENAKKSTSKPNAQTIKKFAEKVSELALQVEDETSWYKNISGYIKNWV